MSKLISIITPLFNRADLILQTIQSVQQQSYPHYEMIIVDDGSTDGSVQKVRESIEQYDQITLYERGRDPKGACTCRNIGFENSSGDYIIFLDSDDLLDKDCLKDRVAEFSQRHDCDFLVFGSRLFNSEIGDLEETWGRAAATDNIDYLSEFLSRPVWPINGPIWKRSWIARLGGFNESLPSFQDWEFHIRTLAQDPNFEVLDQIHDSFIRRGTATRISQTSMKNQKHLRSRLQLMMDVRQLLDDAGKLNSDRRNILARRFVKLSILAKLSGDPDHSEHCLKQLANLESFSSQKSRLLSQYVRIEGGKFFRQPVITSTIRRGLKLFYKLLLPDLVGSPKLNR